MEWSGSRGCRGRADFDGALEGITEKRETEGGWVPKWEGRSRRSGWPEGYTRGYLSSRGDPRRSSLAVVDGRVAEETTGRSLVNLENGRRKRDGEAGGT